MPWLYLSLVLQDLIQGAIQDYMYLTPGEDTHVAGRKE